jgi:hypothetical protein
MKVLSINAQKFNLPGSWNELTPDQLLRIAELSEGERTEADFKLKVLLKVTGLHLQERNPVLLDGELHYYLKTPDKNVYLVKVDDLNEVIEYLNFLFDYEQEKGKVMCVLSSRLTRNLIGPVKVGNEIWHGPADGLSNLKTGEYIRAETCLHNFYEKKNINFLFMLFATLWRPEAVDPESTDIREAFDDGLIEKRSLMVRDVPNRVLLATVLFYTGCRKMLALKFEHASNGKKKADKDVFMSFMRMVNGLANNDVTKHEAVRQTYLMEMMVTVDEMARQAEEMEDKIKKMKK